MRKRNVDSETTKIEPAISEAVDGMLFVRMSFSHLQFVVFVRNVFLLNPCGVTEMFGQHSRKCL